MSIKLFVHYDNTIAYANRQLSQLKLVTALTDLTRHASVHTKSLSSKQELKEQSEVTRYHWQPADAADTTTNLHPNNVHNAQYC